MQNNAKFSENIPKVSIILTVYNHEEFIKEAIESVLQQSFLDFELIIINDGSEDNTRDQIEKYAPNEKIIIKNIDHIGRQKALNLGFKLARGEYITIIDSDDIYLQEKIKRQVDYLEIHHNTVLVGTYAKEYDLINDKEYLNMPPLADNKIRSLLLYEAVLPFPTIMTRREILERVGYCNETIPLKEDFELIAKIASVGKVAVIPDFLVIIRRHHKNSFIKLDPEVHRKSMLKVRWLNLWRLKPPLNVFIKMMAWHSFEYLVHLIPESLRHGLPEPLRNFSKQIFPDQKNSHSYKHIYK